MGLSAETRRQKILERLYEAGRVHVNKLAQQLGVTEVTIRRDLVYLHKKRLLKKLRMVRFLVSTTAPYAQRTKNLTYLSIPQN